MSIIEGTPTDFTVLDERIKAALAKKKRAKDCDHAALVVAQDPDDGSKERLTCPDCDMEPRRRVSAAASIKETSDAALAEMRSAIGLLNETMATRASVEMVMTGMENIVAAMALLAERVVKLEAAH